MTSREAFEAQMRDRYGAHVNLARSEDGYISTVPHAVMPTTYASVQMLWEGYQAATDRARDVAVKACEEMPTEIDGGFCEWAQGIDFASKRCTAAIKEALK